MEALDVTIRIPRLTKKQCNRPNYPTSSSDEIENIISYWKISVYIPIPDFISTDLKDRFAEESVKCYALNFLVPVNLEVISKLHALESQIESCNELLSVGRRSCPPPARPTARTRTALCQRSCPPPLVRGYRESA